MGIPEASAVFLCYPPCLLSLGSVVPLVVNANGVRKEVTTAVHRTTHPAATHGHGNVYGGWGPNCVVTECFGTGCLATSTNQLVSGVFEAQDVLEDIVGDYRHFDKAEVTRSPGGAELAAQEVPLELRERGLSWKMRLRWAQILAKL